MTAVSRRVTKPLHNIRDAPGSLRRSDLSPLEGMRTKPAQSNNFKSMKQAWIQLPVTGAACYSDATTGTC
jgi:hypothetical protein